MAMQAAPAPAEGLSWDWPPPVTPSGYDFVVAARVDSTRDRKSVSYDGQPLPLQLMEWDALDLFVVADPAALQDPAAIEAMRLFMLRGGRLWVMLDQVPGELIQPLLNPRQSLVEVERVMLNQFTIETDYPATDFFESDLFVDLEREVMMARVVQHGGQVLHSVDGWPISMVFPVGYGQLLVTTRDSLAWIEPRTQQRSTDPSHQADFSVRPWGANWTALANVLFPRLPIGGQVD